MTNTKLRGDNSINIQGRITVLVHSTKFNLNGNSSFKVICQTRYCDGQTDGKSLRGAYKISTKRLTTCHLPEVDQLCLCREREVSVVGVGLYHSLLADWSRQY